MNFAKTLKTLIRQRGLTTGELAKAISVSPKTVSDWLVGRSPRDLDAIKRCASHLQVSVHFLLYGEDDPQGSISAVMESTELHTGLYEITIKRVKRHQE